MNTLIIEPHYLGSLEYYTLISKYDIILFDVDKPFKKQTYRNRAYTLGSNQTHTLIVPVSYSGGIELQHVAIDYTQRWVKDHWGAFYSSYGKAPFFEYFSEELYRIWKEETHFLIDLNMKLIQYTFSILGWKKEVSWTHEHDIIAGDDFRDIIVPKKRFEPRKIYQPHPYGQLFGKSFVANLSILDLIMNEGPAAAQILTFSKYQ